MKKLFAVIALGLSLSYGVVHAAGPEADCAAKSTEKKLAGAAKNSFMKKCIADAGGAPAAAAAATGPGAACAATAAEKKLAGAAKNSFMKKCVADAGGAPAATK